jgi:hypothetical protein
MSAFVTSMASRPTAIASSPIKRASTTRGPAPAAATCSPRQVRGRPTVSRSPASSAVASPPPNGPDSLTQQAADCHQRCPSHWQLISRGPTCQDSGTSDASSGCSPSLAAPMLRSSARSSSMCPCPTAGAGASRWCSTTPSSSPRRAPARSRRSASCSGSLSSRCRPSWTKAAARWPASPGWTSSPRSTRTPSAPTPSATLRLPWTGSARSPISPMSGASNGCRERWPRWALPAYAKTPRPNCRPS